MTDSLAHLNGVDLPLSQAGLSLLDAGFTNGAIVTDNCRTWNRKLFRWIDHLQRFRRDCEACCVACHRSDSEMTQIAGRLLAACRDDVHVITFATPSSYGMFTRPVDHERNQRFAEQGVQLKIAGHQPVDASAVLSPQWKHRSRMVWHVAQHRAGEAVAILLDRPGGTLTDTAIGNVLAVINGTLVTPPRELLLDGISLRVTFELAARIGIAWKEAAITKDDYHGLDELLLVGTGFGIAAVNRIDDHQIPWPGPVFQQLANGWKSLLD